MRPRNTMKFTSEKMIRLRSGDMEYLKYNGITYSLDE